jgi:cell fate (sporulation/competence/biofilm development) regulator YmcA (YheA/YmcA/DUF963 family)
MKGFKRLQSAVIEGKKLEQAKSKEIKKLQKDALALQIEAHDCADEVEERVKEKQAEFAAAGQKHKGKKAP